MKEIYGQTGLIKADDEVLVIEGDAVDIIHEDMVERFASDVGQSVEDVMEDVAWRGKGKDIPEEYIEAHESRE